MRILYVTTVGRTMSFFVSIIKRLLERGHVVDIATNESGNGNSVPGVFRDMGCQIYNISCSRSPMSLGNLKAVQEIHNIAVAGNYDIIHCHTPIASACTRFACHSLRKRGAKVLYTAHGFHFYHGSPIKNWVIYYPVEWLCSWFTDTLITINTEDFLRAKRHLHAMKTEYVPGVGIDPNRFAGCGGGGKIRKELGIHDNRFILLSVGELNENKNHSAVIKAIQGLNITYVIVGHGSKRDKLKELANELSVDTRLVGYRTDVADFYDAADAYILPSLREGLNVSIMEAMASGLPCLCGRIRGNVDLIDEKGGYLFNPKSPDEIRDSIVKVLEGSSKDFGKYNQIKVRNYEDSRIQEKLFSIYGIGE